MRVLTHRNPSAICKPAAVALVALIVTLGATWMAGPVAAQDGKEAPDDAWERVREQLVRNPQALGEARLRAARQAPIPLKATSDFTCLPSCDVNDGRFLAIAAGATLVTLSDPVLDLAITVPADTTTFEIGVFDGDGGEPIPPAPPFFDPSTRWDRGEAILFEYTLFASPPGGVETIAAGPFASTTMPNNDWFSFTIIPDALAEAPSGIFAYRFEVRQIGTPVVQNINVFKVRTDAIVTIRLTEQPFSYISRFNTFDDILQIFPDFPVRSTSTYDGDWSFFFDVESQQSDVAVWDGDFDLGRFGGDASCMPQPECLVAGQQDTEDPDTPGAPFLPLFDVTMDAVSEGVAVGGFGTTGAPSDDTSTPALVRQPSVHYHMVLPDGRSFTNDNPSGNQEWEQFVLSSRADCEDAATAVSCPGIPLDPVAPAGLPCADVCLPDDPQMPQLPIGVYEVRADGVDMDNLNALRLPQVLCIDEIGQVCSPLKSFLLGDTVFLDLSGDGVQQVGEVGLNGVIVNLLNSNGELAAVTVTGTDIGDPLDPLDDRDGVYSFAVDQGTYTVQVAPENLAPVAPSSGGAVGDLVWYDVDGDGAQTADEPGLGNVRVNLFTVGADLTVGTLDDMFVSSALTDPDGLYGFSDLELDIRYYAEVVAATVPTNLTLTAAPDTSVTGLITAGTPVDLDLDFGYTTATALVGDLVWNDVDGDGSRDPGEAGIGGVTLDLIDDASGVVVATTTTSEAGSYLFTGVLPGSYEVAVTDTASVLVGYTLTVAPTPPFVVAAGDAILDQDFGYNNASLFDITDRVFFDVDDNTNDNGGTEPGIVGVTVNLVRANVVVATTTSDAGGNFTFPDIPDGIYEINVSDLAGAINGRPESGGFFGAFFGTTQVLLAGADTIGTNFHYGAPGALMGALGDRVWLDADGDGTDNGGTESGISNVVLRLFDSGDGVIGNGDDFLITGTTTDENGFYLFRDLPAFFAPSATYYVMVAMETVPAGLGLSGGTDPSVTRLIDPSDGVDIYLDLDFGYTQRKAVVGDLVWSDADNDGERDAGEAGIGGVTLDLIDDVSATVVATTTTAEDGSYTFDVVAGSYTVEVTDTAGVLVGYTLTVGTQSNPNPTAAFGVVAGDVILTKDFGYFNAALFDITDTVWFDADSSGTFDGGETAISGVTVNLLGPEGNVIATATTDANGEFIFPDLPDGAYSLMITDRFGALAGLLPTTPSAALGLQSVALVGADVVGINFGYNTAGALEGLVGTTLKDEVENADEQTDTVSDANVFDYDFGYIEAGSLGDRVWFDVDGDTTDNGGTEPGIAGVTVTLTNAASGLMETAITDASGFYSFGGLRPTNSSLPGDVYVVTVDDGTLPAGLTTRTFDLDGTGTPDTTDANLGLASPGVAEDRVDVDFGYRGTGSIGDRVWEDVNGDGDQAGESGINGVTVELLDSTGTVIATDVTMGDGDYLFDGLPPGDYTVRVVPPVDFNQTFDLDLTLDNETDVTLGLGENREDVDFGYQQQDVEGSIGDRVWNDVDGDGVQDGGEVGINDVTVRLFNSVGGLVATDVTMGDGDYSFTGLLPDTYTVVIDDTTLPEGFVQTFDIEGPLDHQAVVLLGPGEDRTDVDFGYADECLTDIDFETDGDGASLKKGQKIDDEWAAFGVTVSTGDPGHPAMIFDSSFPTGGDPDLGTPNETFGGPGIGSGGEMGEPGANATALGKVLIISEDGDSNDPDDDAGGGTITFTFAYPVRVDQIGILDIDEGMGGKVTALDGGGAVIGSIAMANNLGNNSVQRVALGVSGVRSLEVYFPGSGAVTDLVFCSDCTPFRVRDDFEVESFSNNDGPDSWTGDWIENDPEYGGTGPLAGQVQVHHGLLTLDDYPNTGGEPSAAREVDLSGALNATMRFKFITSSHVDYDDAVTVEVSNDGGANWTTLEVITGISGSVTQTRNFDISAFISSETQIRFRVSNKYGGSNELFCVTWIVIESSCTETPDAITVRDEFDDVSYTNNDGPDAWESGWVEDDVSGAGPSSGHVKVYDKALKLHDNPNTGTEPSAAREVDLSGGFTKATFSFDFWTTSGVDTNDAIKVEVSSDGGASFTVLETLTGIYGAESGWRSFDISSFISADTTIRFRVSNLYGGSNEYFFADNVQIQAE